MSKTGNTALQTLDLLYNVAFSAKISLGAPAWVSNRAERHD